MNKAYNEAYKFLGWDPQNPTWIFGRALNLPNGPTCDHNTQEEIDHQIKFQLAYHKQHIAPKGKLGKLYHVYWNGKKGIISDFSNKSKYEQAYIFRAAKYLFKKEDNDWVKIRGSNIPKYVKKALQSSS